MKPIRTWTTTAINRMRGRYADRGAGAIEYAGIVILVAGIILAIQGLGLSGRISGAINTWVSAIIG